MWRLCPLDLNLPMVPWHVSLTLGVYKYTWKDACHVISTDPVLPFVHTVWVLLNWNVAICMPFAVILYPKFRGGKWSTNIGFSNFERRVVSSWDSSRSHDVLLSPRASWAFSMSTMCFKLETAMVISRLNFSVDDGSTNFAWIMLKPVQGTQHYYSHEAEGDLDHPCRFSVQREVADLWGWKIVLPGQGFAQVTNGQSGADVHNTINLIFARTITDLESIGALEISGD